MMAMHKQMLKKLPAPLQEMSFAAPKKKSASLEVVHQHKLQHDDSILLVSINGFFVPELSDVDKLPPGLTICDLRTAINSEQNLFPQIDSTFTDGLFIGVSDHAEIKQAIHLLSLISDDQAFLTQPQHILLLGEHSKLRVLEEYFSWSEQGYVMNTLTTIMVGIHAQLQHFKIQHEAKNANHLSHMFVIQMENSQTEFTNFSSTCAFARDELIIKLQEQGAKTNTAGLYCLDQDQQELNIHLDIDHAAPHTESSMLYKGILDKKTKVQFTGRVHVAKAAQKICAYQANHNLLLSKEAEVNTKPILEIYADEVKCKHGATIGQLDQSALFYLCSRGIPESMAKHMLVEGFADEIFARVSQKDICQRARSMVQS
jgi:Fe-S cluster assembly protein SufD